MARRSHRRSTIREAVRSVDPDWDRDSVYAVEYDFKGGRPNGRVFEGKVSARGQYAEPDPDPPVAAPAFVTQPVGGYYTDGDPIVLTAVADSLAESYQWEEWQVSPDPNGQYSRWADVPGETDTSLSVEAIGVWRLRAHGAGGIGYSDAVNTARYPDFLEGYRIATADNGEVGLTAMLSMSRALVPGYAGSLVTLDTGAVVSWLDQVQLPPQDDLPADGTRNFGQSDGPTRPSTAVVNTRDVIRFDGGGHRMISGTWYQDFMDRDEAYVAMAIVMGALTGDDTSDPYDNDVIVSDEGGNFIVAMRQDPGSGQHTIQFGFYADAMAIATITAAETILIGEPLVIAMKLIGGILYGRINVGSWVQVASPGLNDGPFNMLNIGGPEYFSFGFEFDISELVFCNSVPGDEQVDALEAGLLAHLQGNETVPWKSYLPDQTAPWETQIQLDQEFTFCASIFPCEVQYDESGAGFSRAFMLSAENPDWLQVARFEVHPDDDWNGTNRSEIETAIRVEPGQKFEATFKIMVDSATVDPFNLFQFHASSHPIEATDGTSSVFALRYNWLLAGPDHLLVNTITSYTNPAYDGQVDHELYHQPLEKGVWHDVAVRLKFDASGADSLVQVWLNGTLIVDSTDPIGFTVADQYYLKFGAYNGYDNTQNPIILWYAAMEAGVDFPWDFEWMVANPRPDPPVL